jgi:predicted acylesterase/phospholipase RssA
MMTALPPDAPSKKKALLIGGGAPNASLMAGALVAFIDKGVEFDVISTSGAGAVMGLLYQAPLEKTPREALENWVNVGVSDAIYNVFPVDYKVFMKPGPLADMFRNMLYANPFAQKILDQSNQNTVQRLFSDMIQLWWATICPSDLTAQSKGMCAHVPWITQAVDFDRVQHIAPEFYMNAFDETEGKMKIWHKHEITVDHFKAALSFPQIYPPFHLEGHDYIEGAAIDTLNFKALVNDEEKHHGSDCDLDTLVVFDILGSDKLIRPPRNLYDAWVRSIIIPLVEIAKDDIKLYDLVHNRNKDGSAKRRLLKVPLMDHIPKDHWPDVLDWSSSNLRTLYKVGYDAGIEFCEKHAVALNLKAPKSPASGRKPEAALDTRP